MARNENLNTLYNCVEKSYLHIGGKVYGNNSKQQKETSKKNFPGID